MLVLKARSTSRLFISRAGEDREAALGIDQILREAGFSTFIQDNDFGHSSFMARMAEGFNAVEGGGRLIALLSNNYQMKEHCLKEARFPLIDDPNNRQERLIVFRIEECEPKDFLKDIPYVDLVPHLSDNSEMAEIIIKALSRPAVMNPSGEIRIDPKVERILVFLENEDETNPEKALNWILVGVAVVAGALIAFDYFISLWNYLFDTSYYAIFGTGFIIFVALTFVVLMLLGVYWHIRELSKTIVNASLRPSQIRELRSRIRACEWKSKGLIDAALSMATRSLTSGKR